MWGDEPPATATTALHVHLSTLRRVVPGLVSTTGTGYRVELDGSRHDSADFRMLAARAATHARAENWSAVRTAAARGLALWRGTPFDELRNDPFAAPEISRLNEERDNLADLHARALLEDEQHHEAVAHLRQLVAAEPLREPRWEQLMLALYRAGRQAEALRAFQEARRVLGEELGVEPGAALRMLEQQVLHEDPALGGQEATPHHSLPATTTSFVGREADLQRIEGLLGAGRLVTIVGGPGFGKTRLAVEIGRAVLEENRMAVSFVSLADIHNRAEMVGAIATAAGFQRNTATLEEAADQLARSPDLLILDNCEHLLEPCAEFITRVMSHGAGRVRILTTSRRPLGLAAEAVCRVDPLPSPGDERDGTPALASPAVRLFVDRARAADSSYRLTAETAPQVARLCRRAEGIPLALELAARWVPALSVPDIEEMLGAAALPPGAARSHPRARRSLQAAMEWSVALLPPADRQLFLAIAVFGGTFSLEDALAVCTTRADRRRVAGAMARLVDASLLAADRRRDGSVRYRTLIPIREFARERAAGGPDREALRGRFVNHYLGKAYGEDQDEFRQVVDLARVDEDLDNLREAFDIGAAMGRADDVARSAMALDLYFHNRYLAWEQRSRLVAILPMVLDQRVHAALLRSVGSLAMVVGDIDASAQILDEAVAAFRALDDASGLARCLLSRAGVHAHQGEWAEGEAAAREARTLIPRTGNPAAHGLAAYYIGENLVGGGHLDAGLAQLVEAADQYERGNDPSRASHALSTLTDMAVCGDDEALARRSAQRALALAHQSGSTYRLVRALAATVEVESRWGDQELARQRLLEQHRILGPGESERVSEFLMPAAFLLRRLEAWPLLLEVLGAVEEAMVRLREGFPEPWRAMVQQWRLEAPGASAGGSLPAVPRPIEDIERAVLERLGA